MVHGPIEPHGGHLVDRVLDDEASDALREEAATLPSWRLTRRQLCDLELLGCGGFSPLTGFMTRKEVASVCDEMRLPDGTLWPIPIELDVPESVAEGLSEGDSLALRDPEGILLAVLDIEDIWEPDRKAVARSVYGTDDEVHPGVRHLIQNTHPVSCGGPVRVIRPPAHFDFVDHRHTPRELRTLFREAGWERVVAFQTRNPMHRAHLALTLQAARDLEANLLLHPVVGMTKPGDLDHYTRVRCYRALLPHFDPVPVELSLLPLAMRMAGPREALWHAIIRKNYGCTHFIVGRDHAGPGTDASGEPYYGPYDAQTLLKTHQKELGVRLATFRRVVYVPDDDVYRAEDEISPETETRSLSGTELRRRLKEGRPIPPWFTFPEVAEELRRRFPPRSERGFTVFFTGLSAAGKSTTAKALFVKLLEIGDRPVTLLDGDIVRQNLSSELGFSKEDRDTNIRRIGFVASEITKNRGIAICAPIAPYDSIRKEIREVIEAEGGFVLVWVNTPLEECERRDPKGLYAKAREGIVENFTGISDPYEEPTDADLEVDTTDLSPEAAAQRVLLKLIQEGYVAARG